MWNPATPNGELNPAQRRVVDELLGWNEPRPAVDDQLGARVRSDLDRRLAPLADIVPPGEQLWLGKTALDALDCEGRFLDLQAQEFSWSIATIRGLMAHTAIELDHAGRRERTCQEVIRRAWEKVATDGRGSGAFVAGLGGVEADELRQHTLATLLEFRECFPTLPESVEVRPELALAAEVGGARVKLTGKPDLAVGRAQVHGERRLLLLDLKSGRRYPLQHRADMRFYALLATLKYGVPPFRVATFYLDEAAWDAEDVDDEVLEAAVRTVEAKAARGARLRFDPPVEAELRLLAGPACRWCGRAPSCPAKAAAEAGAEEGAHL